MARTGDDTASLDDAAIRRDEESGQGMVEYGLILVLIAIVVVLVLGVVGHQVENVFSNVTHAFPAT